MLRFDTIKFKIKNNFIKFNDTTIFDNVIKKRCGIVIIYNLMLLNKEIPGIKNVQINNDNQTTIFECSAKILENDYFNLLNNNNFYLFTKNLKKKLSIDFNNDDFLEFSKILKFDLTKNIKVNNSINNYLLSLSYCSCNKNFSKDIYFNNSVVFSNYKNLKTSRLRVIFYDKFKELKLDKQFNKMIDLNEFKDILRFEINFNNYKIIRKFFDFDKNTDLNFINIFNHKENVYLKVFDHLELLSNSSDPDILFLLQSNKKLYEVEKLFGRYFLIKLFDYDFEKIKLFIKNKVSGNVSKYLREYRNILNDYLAWSTNNLSLNYLKEIRNKLYDAA